MSPATIRQQDCGDIGVIQRPGSKSAAAAARPAKSLVHSRADKEVSDPKNSFCRRWTWNAYQRSVDWRKLTWEPDRDGNRTRLVCPRA
jgi:hypothetical protein